MVIEAVNDAVTIVDVEGTVLYWNKNAETTYEISREEIVGRRIGDFFQRESVMLFQVMESGQAVYQVYHEPRPGMHVMINTVPVYDDQQQLIGAISIERNVSQYVKLNAELYNKPDGQNLSSAVFPFRGTALDKLSAMSRLDFPLLLVGENGTGKKSMTEWIHRSSQRAGNLVTFNCGSIPHGMLEAELFGYQGDEERHGKLDGAEGGTLYLKDIQLLPLSVQEKLAQALADREFYRVGGNGPIPLRCRIVASSPSSDGHNDKPLQELFYAFQIIRIPALRDRKHDLPELYRLFLAEAAERANKSVPRLSSEAMAALTAFDWPGNLPQLRNVMEYIMMHLEGSLKVTLKDLPEYARLTTLTELTQPDLPLSAHAEELERARIAETLQRTKGNKAKAARLLSISRGSLYYKMKQYGLE